jgi:PAS domain-containing protein
MEAGQIIQTVQPPEAATSRFHAAEALVGGAAAILKDKGPHAMSEFDRLPAPLYATDQNGKIVYFNPACVDFAGRTPALLVDRWCVSWKLYADDGAAMPHAACPMAVAIRNGRPVRGIEAVAERPDGERVRFRPYPTPVLDPEGRMIGAVNLLVLADGIAHRDLLARAAKCRSLAKWVTDKQAQDVLRDMAREFERHAAALRPD